MSYELIETVEVGAGGAASIEFTSIPQDGTDLVLVVSGRHSSSTSIFEVRPNGATTNISTIRLTGFGSTVNSFTDNAIYAFVSSSIRTANTFGISSIYFSNYASSQAKSISVDTVNENNDTSATQNLIAGLWNDTTAISSIEIIPGNSGSATQYSTASLYKVTA